MRPIQNHCKSDYNLIAHSTNTQDSQGSNHKHRPKNYYSPKILCVQPVRTTITSQHSNNPFKRHSTTTLLQSIPTSFEFINYKAFEVAQSLEDMESIREEEPQKEQANSKSPNPEQNDSIISDCENEIRLELLIGTLLNNDIRKDMAVISKLQPITMTEIESKRIMLPETHFKNTIVLDIDETLMHTLIGSYTQTNETDHIINVKICDKLTDIIHTFQAIKRPYVELFLKILSENFELIVY